MTARERGNVDREREEQSGRYEGRGKAVIDRGGESQCSVSNLPLGTMVDGRTL